MILRFFLLVLILLPSPLQAQDLVALGRAEASEHCARCHPAITGTRVPKAEAERFRRITQEPDPRAALAILVDKGHAGLDSAAFSQAELGALAAYIAARKW